MNFYQEVGSLLLGSRLKRLGDKFIQDMGLVYKSVELDFEAAWFPFVYWLHHRQKTSLTKMSSALEISHSAASQMISMLEKKGLVEVLANAEDGRKKTVLLTDYGKQYVRQLLPVWKTMDYYIERVLLKANDLDVLDGLSLLEKALADGEVSGKVIEELAIYKGVKVLDVEMLSMTDKDNLRANYNWHKSEKTLVALMGGKMVALLSSQNAEGSLNLSFQLLNGIKDIHTVGKTLLNKILTNRSKETMIVLTDPTDEFLQTVMDSGYSFTVNRKKR